MYFFVKNLKFLRKRKNLTQKDLSEILGISLQAVKMMETEQFKPSTDTLIKIRNYFEVNLDDLIFVDLENKS